MRPEMLRVFKAAFASSALLLVLAPYFAARDEPRVKKSVTRAERAEWRGVPRRPEACEARRGDDCGGPRAAPDTSRWPRVGLKE